MLFIFAMCINLQEMIKALAPKWSAIECSYILTAKHVFQMMRTEQETHCHYFYDRRSQLTLAEICLQCVYT